jgi:hypothetical protein
VWVGEGWAYYLLSIYISHEIFTSKINEEGEGSVIFNLVSNFFFDDDLKKREKRYKRANEYYS